MSFCLVLSCLVNQFLKKEGGLGLNTKKIWLWSLIMGTMVALVAYFSFLPRETVTTTASVNVSQEDNKDDSESIEEEEQGAKREMSNPMLEVGKGKRAISIAVDLVPGVSGYVEPESQVDVIAYETTEDEKKEKKFKSAVLVLENIRVLASGKSADNQEEALYYQSVTLEVTPEEGVMLGLASKDKDGFYLMLRNKEDTETGKKGYKETRELLEDDDKEAKE